MKDHSMMGEVTLECHAACQARKNEWLEAEKVRATGLLGGARVSDKFAYSTIPLMWVVVLWLSRSLDWTWRRANLWSRGLARGVVR